MADDMIGAGFEDRTVLVTGAARGQGRSHALAFAERGARLVICDVPVGIQTVRYGLATRLDLEETAEIIRSRGACCIAEPADVRNPAALRRLVERAVVEFSGVDVLVANAGVTSLAAVDELTDQMWEEVIATNLTGVFYSIRAALPVMRRRRWGRIVVTGSSGSKMGLPHESHYAAAKWGVIGLVKSVALEVAQEGITVNAVCPTAVDTTMIHNEAMYRLFRPDLEHPTRDDVEPMFTSLNPQGLPWISPADVTSAVLFLASPAAAHITGETLSVSAGLAARNAG